MKFERLPLAGAWVIDLEQRHDHRGFFARAYCRDEFLEHGIARTIAQANLCLTLARGTIRGMHYQAEPFAEGKLVRCVRGAMVDVLVDLREGSPTYLQHAMVELTAANRRMVYVPEGYAHGYQTLDDDTEVLYMVTERYAPDHERGLRWDDPALGIPWPLPNPIISARDQAHPLISGKRVV